MDLKPLNNLVIENGDLRLRELRKNDHDRIVSIARAYSARATRRLYDRYKQYDGFRQTMLAARVTPERRFFEKLLCQFEQCDDMYAKHHIKTDTPEYQEFLNTLEESLRQNAKDNALFSPYGPIQAPFDTSVAKYIHEAYRARGARRRTVFTLGIEAGTELIGCFDFDFIKHTTPGYCGETTFDPGICIDPAYRINSRKKRWWPEVFSLAAECIERLYPFEGEDIPVSATTHRLNRETRNIFNPAKGFTELKETIVHKDYGERRFFTISRRDFIRNFRLPETNRRIKIYNILSG